MYVVSMLVCAHNIFVITFSKPGVSIFQPFHPFSGHLGVKATKGPVHSYISVCVSFYVLCHTSRPIDQPPLTASITNFSCQRSRKGPGKVLNPESCPVGPGYGPGDGSGPGLGPGSG